MTYEELAARVVTWAQTQPAIRAVINVGSRARAEYPADRWSDLDLIVFTTDRPHYAADPAWLHKFGTIWVTYQEATAPGDAEWYVVYEGGLKLDVILLQVDHPALALADLLPRYPYQEAFARGIKVLYDQQGSARTISAQPHTPDAPPSAAEFDHVISGFLMAAVTTAKFITRGDFYRAQRWFASDLHVHLLTMIRWHALGRDRWYGARFIEQWADPRVLAALPQTFALYERASLQTALLAILDLFWLIGMESAARFDLTYPTDTHDNIRAVIVSSFAEST
ncbi:MAG TPA: aminoglycoside 6-adenylyltransferase [Phototrophicaceae bacterium]|nr:aminoglycoside 6-adenylyltransferase [Phototrophicaceae bacterium]